MTNKVRSYWGWGWAEELPDEKERETLSMLVGMSFKGLNLSKRSYPSIESIELPTPRVKSPEALSKISSGATFDRASHSYGKSYYDIIRGFKGVFPNPPDLVLYPENTEDIQAVFEWCQAENIALVPYGGGTSVVQGVECDSAGYAGWISLDMTKMDRVLEVDQKSKAALIQGGASGPVLQSQLAEHGLTLRHYPQSFEFSTLGGWVATRAGGHFATLYTHIDDLVESVTMVTPEGEIKTRRLPGSGAGPSPDRFCIGSEGTMGVITEAWIKVQEPPVYRSSLSARFKDYTQAVEAVRKVSQAGLYPSNCRLLDGNEARLNGISMSGESIFLLAFESSDHDTKAWMERGVEIISEFGGQVGKGPQYKNSGDRVSREDEGGSWRKSFFSAPYRQSALVSLGMMADTFETSITWDKFDALHQAVIENVQSAMNRLCGQGLISCRFTHVYSDGPAPYYTFIAPAIEGKEIENWQEIKKIASDTLYEFGATITHHHAVGRMHRPWYKKQSPDMFSQVLQSSKKRLDPDWILNPGVLIEKE